MNVRELKDKAGLEVLTLPDGEKEVTGGYAGDLLSWVMGKAEEGDAWVTIMSDIDKETLEKAEDEGVNILRSEKSTFALCSEIASLIK